MSTLYDLPQELQGLIRTLDPKTWNFVNMKLIGDLLYEAYNLGIKHVEEEKSK